MVFIYMTLNKFTTNNNPTAVAVSNADGESAIYLWADPTTHRLLVDAVVSIDPAGLATSANQTNGLQLTQLVDAGGDAVTVTGGKLDVNASFAPSGTQDVNLTQIGGASLALGQAVAASSLPVVLTALQLSTLTPPSNTDYATETTLLTRLSGSDFDTKVGSLTEAAPATDTASSGLNGRLQRIAQRLTSIIALLPGSLGQKARALSLAVTLSSEDITVLSTLAKSQATSEASTNVTNSTSNQTALAANSSRLMATFYNDDTLSTSATVYLKCGATASTTSFKIKIAPGGYFELPSPVYTGIIDVIATANTGTLRVTETT